MGAIPPSLDDNDNWLPNPRIARDALGPDPFTAFLPLYIDHLQQTVVRLLSEQPRDVRTEGCDQVIASDTGELRVKWGEASAPQIESYFERYHSRAVEAVRRAGTAILDGDHRNELRIYAGNADFQREADCFRLLLDVNQARKLVIYAKTATRLRFEVRRPERGRYGGLERPTSPTYRLLGIIDLERARAIAACRWEDIGHQFDDPDVPTLGDLVDLIVAIVGACGSDVAARVVMRPLLVDGGISSLSQSEVPEAAIDRLVASGVLERVRLRQRHPPRLPIRYRLAFRHQALRDRLIRVFRIAEVNEGGVEQ